MTAIQQTEGMLELLLLSERPTLAGRCHVSLARADRFFECSPYRAGVSIVFGHGALASDDFMRIIAEAAASAEQIALGISIANAHRLDPLDWWIFRQRELPCSE